jgi:hypothetical protein
MGMPPLPPGQHFPEDPFPEDDDPPIRPPAPGGSQGSLLTSRRLTVILAVAVAVLALIAVLPSLGITLPRISVDYGPGQATPSPSLPAGSASASPAGSPTFVRPTPSAAPTFTSYVVKAGDSLGTIATLYRTTARSIAWWNRGSYPTLDPESAAYNPSHIDVGWTLVVLPGVVVDDSNPPSPSPGKATPTPGPTASGAPGASGSPAASGTTRPASPSPAASK